VHVAELARVLRGEWDAAPIERFVERFVRPGGIETPVAPLVATAALELARAGAPAPA